MNARAASSPSGARAPEFLAWPPLLAVVLFTFNNFWLKGRAPGLLSGKLSDFAACFFLPLFLSALLAHVTPLPARARVAFGAAITVVVFTSVKTSAAASGLLDALCAALGSLERMTKSYALGHLVGGDEDAVDAPVLVPERHEAPREVPVAGSPVGKVRR